MKLASADQAAKPVKNNSALFLGGLAMISLPEEVLRGLERRYLDSGHPQTLTTWACAVDHHAVQSGAVRRRTRAGKFAASGVVQKRPFWGSRGRAYYFHLSNGISVFRK